MELSGTAVEDLFVKQADTDKLARVMIRQRQSSLRSAIQTVSLPISCIISFLFLHCPLSMCILHLLYSVPCCWTPTVWSNDTILRGRAGRTVRVCNTYEGPQDRQQNDRRLSNRPDHTLLPKAWSTTTIMTQTMRPRNAAISTTKTAT